MEIVISCHLVNEVKNESVNLIQDRKLNKK